jgi:hypothetical protein
MRRLTVTLLTLTMTIGLGAGPAHARARLSKTTGPLPAVKDAVIHGACSFDVLWSDRGGRTLTTWARGRSILRQEITGTSQVILTNADTKLSVTFDIDETATLLYGGRGVVTTFQAGDSGLIFDPGTSTRAGSFTWYGGVAATRGHLDPNTLLYSDVSWQRRFGPAGDVCEMLVTGLKTRH